MEMSVRSAAVAAVVILAAAPQAMAGAIDVAQVWVGHEVRYGSVHPSPAYWDITGETGPTTRTRSAGGASPNHTTATVTSTLLHTAGTTTWNLNLAHYRGAHAEGGTATTVAWLEFFVTSPTAYDFSGWYETANQPGASSMGVRLLSDTGFVFAEEEATLDGPFRHELDGDVSGFSPGLGWLVGSPSGVLAPGFYAIELLVSVGEWEPDRVASALGDFSFHFGDSVSVIPLPQTAPLAALGLLLLAARRRRATA